MLNSIDGPMSDIKKNSIQFEKANMNGTLIYSENNYSGIKYERGNKEIMSDISVKYLVSILNTSILFL